MLPYYYSVSEYLKDTYGDGELPDEIVDFYEDLADLDLSGVVYSSFICTKVCFECYKK